MFELVGKKVVVLGLAKSGTTIAKILHKIGANVIVNDAKEEDKCVEKKELEELGIKVLCGRHPKDLINKDVDLLVKNPGIPYRIDPIQRAMELNIPIITEVELAYQFSKAPVIGITGSNGKTTTTTLIGEILELADKNPIVAGNIGTVLSEKALSAEPSEVLVSELSSFQLKGTVYFKPHIAVLLNIYPAHIDYHQTTEDYITSKAKIFANQQSTDYAVINAECADCIQLTSFIKSMVYYFSTKKPVQRGAYIENGKIFWVDENEKVEILSLSEMYLKGAHLENALASLVATRLYGADFEMIKRVLRSFKGVEHRQEFVKETTKGVMYYNDSKATNPQATLSALTSFNEPIILIAGGLDRGIDFKEFIEPFKNHVKVLITYGQTKDKLNKIGELAGLQSIFTVDNINDAVELSHEKANKGDTVLLSPGCASWDMFLSFEERGRIFKEAVHRLK